MRRGVVELLDAQVILGGYWTDRPTYMCQSNMPIPSFEGGHNYTCTYYYCVETRGLYYLPENHWQTNWP